MRLTLGLLLWLAATAPAAQSETIVVATSEVLVEWPVQQVAISLLDQYGDPIAGMNGQSSTFNSSNSGQVLENQSVVSLPITDNTVFPTISGTWADGYDLGLNPALIDVAPNGGLLRRVEYAGTTEVSTTTDDLTFGWVTIQGPLQVVDQNGSEIDESQFKVVAGATPTGTGSIVSLLVTDNTLYPGLAGNFADGYDFYIRPGGAPSFSGPFAMELLSDGAFSPAFVNIDGVPVGLRFVTNEPPTLDAQSFNIDENGIAVGTVIATDPDLPDETLAYSISGGPDGGLFTIDSVTGALSFLDPPEFEAPLDAGGLYDFQNVAQATYTIRQKAQPEGYLDGLESMGVLGGNTIDSPDSNEITGIVITAPGTQVDSTGYDFAELLPASVQGLVWEDFNDNGEFPAGVSLRSADRPKASGTSDTASGRPTQP